MKMIYTLHYQDSDSVLGHDSSNLIVDMGGGGIWFYLKISIVYEISIHSIWCLIKKWDSESSTSLALLMSEKGFLCP